MNEIAIAKLILAMTLPLVVEKGQHVDWVAFDTHVDETLQKAIPIHWVEGPLQAAADLFIGAAGKAFGDPKAVPLITAIGQAAASGDVAGAESQLVQLVVEQEPELKPLLGAA